MDGSDSPERKLTNSQRALGIKDTPRDHADLDRFREEWRLAADAWSAERDNADRLELGRATFKDQLILKLIDDGMPASKAERVARTCEPYKEYLRKLSDSKRRANDLWNDMRDKDIRLKNMHAQQWNHRAEMFLSR